MLLGALIQGLASAFLPYRNIVAVLPVILILCYKTASMLLMTYGLIENPRMKPVIPGRTGLILPDEKGMPSTAGESSVCVIVLSSVSHHPLGGLAPGLAEVGHRFDWMVKELSENATQNGYLGYSRYLGSGERTDSNEVMSMVYFENEDYLYQYARSPLHSKAAKWWRETEQKHKHIGILHEVFSCPKKNWEAVYINYNPVGK